MPASEVRKNKPLRVLVICGDEGVFAPALQKLKEEGLEAETTQSVYRAVASFSKSPADIVIVELDPLGDSELECVRVFRELNRGAHILAVFSQAHRQKAAKALQLGADGSLLQPFYPAELVAILKRLAERIRTRRSLEMDYPDQLAALRRLANGIAHQINNPLTSLSGWLELMESDEGRDPEERERLASICEEADRIAQVVKQLLAFSQEAPAERYPVDVNALLADLLEDVRRRANGIDVQASLQAEGATVWGDQELLRQASKIILDDAVAALNGTGTLAVEAAPADDGFFELRVRHDGRPIPIEELAHIFEPYRSLPYAGQGADEAYPTAYGIVRSHGGELSVTSDGERGAEVLVRLPSLRIVPQWRQD